jgi:hypothetical protein
MIVRENINFERGIDPKISMDIGNKWTRIKVGDVIECVKRTIVRAKRRNLDYISFEEYSNEIFLRGQDYAFDPGNIAIIQSVEKNEGNIILSVIPFESKEDTLGIKDLAYYISIRGNAPMEKWAEFFKVI